MTTETIRTETIMVSIRPTLAFRVWLRLARALVWFSVRALKRPLTITLHNGGRG